MELACVGKVDQHFIGAPSHSLFRQQYHQHGNFSVDWCVKDPFRGTGRTFKATISKEGDLLIGGMIVVKRNGNRDRHLILTLEKGIFKQEIKKGTAVTQGGIRLGTVTATAEANATTIEIYGNLARDAPEGYLVFGLFPLVDDSGNSVNYTFQYDEEDTLSGECRLLIGNQCIQTREIVPITLTHRSYNPETLPEKSGTDDIYGAEFFFVKEKTPMWLHTNQTIQMEIRLEDSQNQIDEDRVSGAEKYARYIQSFNNDVTMHFQSFQVYLPENERTPPSMQHLPIRVEQIMDYNPVDIQPNSPLRIKLPFNLPIYKLHHGLDNEKKNIVVRVYVNNNLRFEATPNEIQAIASLFFEDSEAIMFGIPSENGFGGAFNMSRADTVEIEFIFDTMVATGDEIEAQKQLVETQRADIQGTDKDPKSAIMTAYSYNILQYQNGKYSLLYSD